MMPRLSQVAQLTWIGSAKGHKTSRFLKLLIIIQRQWVLASVVMLSVANAQPLPHPKAQTEYARVSGKGRRFIKGQKYMLLARHENLSLEGKRSLTLLLAANKRLNTAYVLKESFGQLWDYEREGWARRFFENWRASLKWQRLAPYEKFAEMIDRHWNGIAAYCKPENKVSLGFVEGLNNKIRVIQRRAYGLRDQEYLRLKVLTCMLPAL